MTETVRMNDPASVPLPSEMRRANALDALRGLAILGMVLSAQVPSSFPAWMCHAQTPPPERTFNPAIPGITWVDLVFPFFLFSMGAAIPLALNRRIASGMPAWRGALVALQRLVLLGLFGVYVVHIRPWAFSSSPGATDWLRALAAFAILFPILLRLPDRWPAWLRYAIRAAGWAGAVVLMYTFRSTSGALFSLRKSDIIIMILANVLVGTTLAWLITRRSWLMRIALLGFLIAIRLSIGAGTDNWVAAIWTWKPPHLSWLWVTGYWSYLFLTIPGTVAGDMLTRWLKPEAEAAPDPAGSWGPGRMAALGAVAFAFTPLALWGLFTRHLTETVFLSAVLGLAALWLAARPADATERLLAGFTRWGFGCLMLGLTFEPYEGGIKKDPATMSYYFVGAGLALLLLLAFTVAADVFRGRRALALLIGNGQNPMIAYVGFGTLIQPILFLTGINPWLNRFTENRPGAQFAHGAAATLLLAVAVWGFSRKRLFWRT